jgi:hypothetical protein
MRRGVYGLLPAAVGAAVDHDFALLKRVVATIRVSEIAALTVDPSSVSFAQLVAATCHDYPIRSISAPRPSSGRPNTTARWRRSIGRTSAPSRPPPGSSPGSGRHPPAWAGRRTRPPGRPCTAGSYPTSRCWSSPATSTPTRRSSRDARPPAQFPRATFAVIANAGHTPDAEPCGAAMAIDFIRHLRTDPDRCRRAGSPPAVVGRPARRAADLPAPVRRAVAVALATIADAQAVAEFAQIGRFDALRASGYVATKRGLRIKGARVVRDAAADGTLRIRRRGTRTRLRLRGPAVPPARLTLRSAGTTTRITGTVAGRRLALRVPSTQ